MKKVVSKLMVACLISMSMVATANAATNNATVTVTATVTEGISITCDTGSVNLGNIVGNTVATGTSTCTVTTNSSAGYTFGVESDSDNSTAGLYSAGTSQELEAVASTGVVGGTDGFGLYVSTAAAGAVIAEGFDHDSTLDTAVTTTSQTAVTYDDAAPAGEDTEVSYRAAAASTTPSGSYSSVITYTSVTQ
jgi:hypothetical protein